MKVLVADKFEKSGLDGLTRLGVELDYQPDLSGDTLQAALASGGVDVLIVRGTKVSEPMIQGSSLALIVRAGAGYNTIDVAAASARGIRVSNCPGKNSQAVAELAFGLMISCDRHIPDNVVDLRHGKWNKKTYSKAKGLYGRTLGLIGMGRISQEMISRGKAFGMNVAAYSRWMTPETAAALGISRATSVLDIAKMSDFVSVHVSLTRETQSLLGKEFFAAMKPGAVFVNTSRGEVVDQAAMEAALAEKNLTAGLDVFADEPSGGDGEYSGSLKDNPRVYCTHHIGASTDQAQEAVAEETVRIVREFQSTGVVPNVVNVAKGETATHLLVVRHADRVGVLAHVLGVLREEGISVQEMENVVLGGAKAAIAQIAVDKCPSSDAIVAMKQNPNVFDVSAVAIQK
ncbi:MAG TPA: phosphoglycerate dehydrogenase [Fimbriimonadaceae bacterium]|nr:phosphoglycerate dehydrogenase [Fimbriimonadaceae bacterium]